MLFSYKQFEQTKNQIIKQFEEKPALQFECQDNATLNQYKKLLNQIIHDKKKRNKKNTEVNLEEMHQIKSTSRPRNRVTLGNMSRIKTAKINTISKKQIEDKIRNSAQLEQCNAEENNIYITSLLSKMASKTQNSCKNIEQETESAKQVKKNQKIFSAVQIQEESEDALDPQHEQMLNLRVNIFQHANQEKYMHTEISELEQAIRYYKKLNTKLQAELCTKDRRYNNAIADMLKTQTHLNNANFNKKYLEQRLENVENYFSRSLKCMKWSKKNQTQKCTEMVDTIVQNMLTLKYLQQKKDQQKLQIEKLEQKSRYKSRKIEESKNMHKYAQILLRTYQVSNYIRSNSYGKIGQFLQFQEQVDRTTISIYLQRKNKISKHKQFAKDSIVDILDKSYWNKCDNEGKSHQPKIQVNDVNFLSLIKEILKSYFKLRTDESKLKQIYEQKIIQIEGSRKSLHKQLSQKIKQLETAQKSHRSSDLLLRKTDSRGPLNQPQTVPSVGLKKEQFRSSVTYNSFSSYFAVEQELKVTEAKTQKINETILLFKERVKFFIKKCILRLENVIQKWLKFDQSAINFVVQLVDLFIIVGCQSKENFNILDSKNILMDYFQNWEQYTFFIQYLHTNPIICRVLTPNLLKNTLKKVVKTKQNNQGISTKKILIKVLKNLYRQKSEKLINNIKSLLKIGADLIQYSLKYQVLIVNCYQMPGNNVSNPNASQNCNSNSYKEGQNEGARSTNRALENKSQREQSQQFYSKFIGSETEVRKTNRNKCFDGNAKVHNVESELDDTSSQVNINNNQNICPIERKCNQSAIKEEFVTSCIQEYQQHINCVAKANRMHEQI